MERQTSPGGSEFPSRSSTPRQKLKASFGVCLIPLFGGFILWITAPKPPQGDLKSLLSQASLAQSLPIQPQQPLPRIWKQRLPPLLAMRLWRQGKGSWLQIWGPHADSSPLLLLRAGKEADTVPLSLRWGPYRVVAADALGLQSLQQSLRNPAQHRFGPRCAALESSDAALFWSGSGLVATTANWSPFLMPLQQGCFQLQGMRWWGKTRGGDGVLRSTVPMAQPQEPVWPTSAAPLLLQGDSLAPLLGPLLEPLLDGASKKLLLQSPFQLQLLFNPANNPYQASIWISLQPQGKRARQDFERLLERLKTQLPAELQLKSRNGVSELRNPKGWVQAGWRWQQNNKLLIVLGASPNNQLEPGVVLSGFKQLSGLTLVAAPRLLDQRGLLPGDMPLVLKKSALFKGHWRAGRAGAAAQVIGVSETLD